MPHTLRTFAALCVFGSIAAKVRELQHVKGHAAA
jgi:hypothetical protein